MRYQIPSPFEELLHTADVGIKARGANLPELYAKAALAMSQLQAGGGMVEQTERREIVANGEDSSTLLVDLCRRVLAVFNLERLLLQAIEVVELSNTRLIARCDFGPFDHEQHTEGMDVKAVTYANAAVEPLPEGGWLAILIFDI